MKIELKFITPDPEAHIGEMAAECYDSKTSGVYEILLKEDGRQYIGSAIDIADRWRRHKKDLRKGKHHSIHLQRAWDKYGEGAFKFKILEPCVSEKEVILGLEQKYLDAVSPEFNSCKLAKSPLGIKHSAATRAKVSAASKKLWSSKSHKAKHSVSMAEAAPKIRAAALAQHSTRSERAKKHNSEYWNDDTKAAQSAKRISYSQTTDGHAQLVAAGKAMWSNSESVAARLATHRVWLDSEKGKAAMLRMNQASQNPISRKKQAEAVSIKVKVVRLSDGECLEFGSMKNAEKYIGVSNSGLSSSVKRNGTTGGYKVELA